MKAIVACDLRGAIGYKNNLLHRSPADMKNFVRLTKHKTIVMGYNTFCSLPFVLSDRRHIVFTKKLVVHEVIDKFRYTKAKFGVCPDIHIVNSVESFFQLVKELKLDLNEMFVIGGEQIYNLLFDYVSEFHVTVFNKVFVQADAFFPLIALDRFEKNIVEENSTESIAFRYALIRRK